MSSGAAAETADDVTVGLAATLARCTALALAPAADDAVEDAVRIDRIALLEQIKAAAAAAQHTQMVRFARSQVEKHIADDTLDPKAVGRGVGDQIALACRASPAAGGSAWPGRCTTTCPASAPCWRRAGSAKTPRR